MLSYFSSERVGLVSFGGSCLSLSLSFRSKIAEERRVGRVGQEGRQTVEGVVRDVI